MGWWQEVEGDVEAFLAALRRAAAAARSELAALDACARPKPMRPVRELWDACEAALKADGACTLDFPAVAGLPQSLATACAELLRGGDVATQRVGDVQGHPLGLPAAIFSALAAEVQRVFGMVELQATTEVRVSRQGAGEAAPSGPEVDNGGLLPDNRREVSFRMFVPVRGDASASSASLMLRTKDGERSLAFDVRPCRVVVWWSRQTFHQLLGGEGYFAIAGWGVVPQKVDKA
mmetsp:Transcript_781/g.2164  ORF Transcript_781/g.2164 Transcript_781/m.2164 type:complete len:234 (+) Transcript_781:84-785(+)